MGRNRIPIEKRFYDKVDKTDGCWEWIAYKNHAGYGIIGYEGITYRAHRLAWLMNVGEIPEGKVVCHKCDNPGCVNIEHLFLGTQLENIQDRNNKSRTKAARGNDVYGSKLSEKQVLEIRELYPSLSSYKLSDIYGITKTAVLCIVKRKTWKHI